ncbi:hypothetical protein QJQ45_008318 [Haematococcus lacustris]|nr:hypothetical protein QJQ45_008318 [Haematococcus lacustris]
MWCPQLPPRQPPQPPGSRLQRQAGASEPGLGASLPAHRIKTEQAAEPAQPTEGKGQGKGKTAKFTRKIASFKFSSGADISNLSCMNLFLQLCRDLPGDGENTRESAAVAVVLAAHSDLRACLEAIPRYLTDTNMVDHVGEQLQTAFGNILTLLFAGRLKKSVSLAGHSHSQKSS